MAEAALRALAARLAALRAEARASGQRRGLVLAGPADATRALLCAALEAAGALDDAVWVGFDPPGGRAVRPEDARAVLGQQAQTVVIDLVDRCHADALGAASGVAAGGGLVIVRVPPAGGPARTAADRAALAVEGWPADAVGARFPARVADALGRAPGVETVELADGALRGVRAADPVPPPPPVAPFDDPDCLTADQARAVEAVLRVALGRRRRPVVLRADRGRGKSAALGIAAGRLLRDHPSEPGTPPRTIALIAPARAAVEPVFAHAARVAGAAFDPARLRFVAPAELAAHGPPEASLVLVDEAAALPVELLAGVLAAHPRVVFSTTVHGYEGTGRGFAVRFTALLDARAPRWRTVRLAAPIRWAAGDPVERAVFRALLLDARPAPDAAVVGDEPPVIERLDRDRLAADEATLGALFGLLVSAHYRTSPADLERLLDGPNVAVWAARRGGAVVGCALVTREGGLDPALATAIHRAERRPSGHMLPETLAAHLGLADAPRRVAWRVVRIAVHAAARGRGVGSALLDALAARATAEGVDLLGSAFGATEALLRFWTRAGLAPVRVGLTRGKSSGLRSAVVLRPLSPAGRALVDAARARFARRFPHGLGGPLADLDPGLSGALFAGAPVPRPALDEAERAELLLFAEGRRVYGAVLDLLWALAPWAVAAPETAEDDRRVLVIRVLQGRDWGRTAAALGLSGRAAASRRLGAAVRRALKRWSAAAAGG